MRIEEDGSSDGYGTPTADALLAFRALGVPADAPECADALTWLKEHHDTQANPGIGRTHASFGPSMRYYYRAVSSRAFAIYGGPADWEVEMSSALVADQQEDGSFVNAFILQKEDEPVIATSLAIVAWCATLGIV